MHAWTMLDTSPGFITKLDHGMLSRLSSRRRLGLGLLQKYIGAPTRRMFFLSCSAVNS